MNGQVDDERRALVEIVVGAPNAESKRVVTAWVDTAFTGYLVFSRELIAELGLPHDAATMALLADGTQVVLDCYLATVEWFGAVVPAQVIANEGKLPLLGTELLAQRRLMVDYQDQTVTIY